MWAWSWTTSERRGRTLIIAGVGLALAMLLLVLYQWIGRRQLVASSQSPELAGAFYDALTGYLTILLWLVLGIGAAAAAVGLLSRYVRAGRTRPAS